MPLQFDVAEIAVGDELKFSVTTAHHEPVTLYFDNDRGMLRIEGIADPFWQRIEEEMDKKIQFENL